MIAAERETSNDEFLACIGEFLRGLKETGVGRQKADRYLDLASLIYCAARYPDDELLRHCQHTLNRRLHARALKEVYGE